MGPPGERYSYSNLGYILAGRLLEVVTGRSYEEAMRDLVLGPLGLKSTSFSGDHAIAGRIVPAHIRATERPPLVRGSLTRTRYPVFTGLRAVSSPAPKISRRGSAVT